GRREGRRARPAAVPHHPARTWRARRDLSPARRLVPRCGTTVSARTEVGPPGSARPTSPEAPDPGQADAPLVPRARGIAMFRTGWQQLIRRAFLAGGERRCERRCERRTNRNRNLRPVVTELEDRTVPSGLTPAQISSIYGFDQIKIGGGT